MSYKIVNEIDSFGDYLVVVVEDFEDNLRRKYAAYNSKHDVFEFVTAVLPEATQAAWTANQLMTDRPWTKPMPSFAEFISRAKTDDPLEGEFTPEPPKAN